MEAFLARTASLGAFEIAAKNALLERKRELNEGLLRVDWFAGECRVAPSHSCVIVTCFFMGGWVGRCAGVRETGRRCAAPPPWGGGAAHGDSWGKMGQALFRLIFNEVIPICGCYLVPDRLAPGRP